MIDYKRFRRILNQECQVYDNDKILVGISGGADSVALLHLLSKCNNSVIAAHCNFQLRGDESDRDEEYVKEICKELDVTLVVNHFNTTKYAIDHKISIEMAARELRYDWFDQLCHNHQIRYIAVGHHSGDQVETFFINLTRGTGLRGLTGMELNNGKIIRPLLNISKQEVVDYCKENDLHYCEDSSNNDDNIYRNKIRNQIIPLFETLNPSFKETMLSNMNHLTNVYTFLNDEILKLKADLWVEEDDTALISIRKLKEIKAREVVLFELLKDKGFNPSQINDINDSIDGESGKQFFSDEYRLIRDRHNLVILKKTISDNDDYYIELNQKQIEKPIRLFIEHKVIDDEFLISKDKNCIHLDASLVEYPFVIRQWKKGDSFRPLGMKKFKKLSDFFIDEKFSLLEKESTWLMTSNDNIVWVIGARIDDRYKVSSKTTHVLEIKLLPN